MTNFTVKIDMPDVRANPAVKKSLFCAIVSMSVRLADESTDIVPAVVITPCFFRAYL
jgi:hypothetical protein